ncbi:cytochrome c oxidase subunit 5B, mitochondrial-like [Pararge aegeria]|uniref:Jg27790 protein n=1 Tax=Pararge aegeria aegeria TaxID=348720 RepID=A0A8S4S5N6_9NEOP|nr:cytochrome c oxidase subunit 5B, mitochondrial-like [Pararge aegeria]CAH2245916.1 jg27790 [Pararge aegeria aegeria]
MWWLRSMRPLQRAGKRIYGTFHDTLDQLTGIQKRELLAHLAGECDPFRILSIKKGPGTHECPNLIPSAYCSRLVGCVCHPDTMHIEWIVVHMGWPRRCGCGYWFELCPIAPL